MHSSAVDFQAAVTFFQTEMKNHGLLDLDWTWEFDEAKRRFGACRMPEKVISLSRPLVQLNPEEEVRDTILHEIAHALAWEEHGENCGHDQRWKNICERIGAKPIRCYDDEVIQPEAPWVLSHRETGEIFGSYQRKPQRDFSEVWIRGRKEETFGKLELKVNPKLSMGGKFERFDRESLLGFREEVLAAIQGVAEARGVTVEAVKGSFSHFEYNLSLKFKIPAPDGVDPEKEEFELLAGVFGLEPEDYQRQFRFQGKTYLLIGFKVRNRKYPVIGVDAQGRRYKFDLEVLDGLLNR